MTNDKIEEQDDETSRLVTDFWDESESQEGRLETFIDET